jgi:hypothetical protein
VWPLGSRLFLAGILFLLVSVPASGAPPARLHAANSLLIMEQPFPRSDTAGAPIVIYREPGIGRIATGTLPELSRTLPHFAATAGQLLVPARRRKGQWVRIIYDDAGREGWLRLERGWQVVPWSDYLPEMTVRLLPGLKKSLYIPLAAPAAAAADNGPSLQNETLRVVSVEDDWVLAETASGLTGWVRWRDDDGRLTITPWPEPENH